MKTLLWTIEGYLYDFCLNVSFGFADRTRNLDSRLLDGICFWIDDHTIAWLFKRYEREGYREWYLKSRWGITEGEDDREGWPFED